MPRLPDRTDLGQRPIPQSQRGGVSTPDATPYVRQMYGAVTSELAQELKVLQEQEDFNDVMSVRAAADKWEADTIRDPEKGAITKQRRDAFGLDKTLPAEFDKFSSEAIKGVRSDRAKKLASEVLASRRDRVSDWSAAHVLQQRKVDATETFEANIVNAQNAPTPSVASATEQAAVLEASVRSFYKGADAQVVQSKVAAAQTGLYQNAIKNALATDDVKLATELRDEALKRNALTADAHTIFTKQIKEKERAITVDTVSTEAVAQHVAGRKLGEVDEVVLDGALRTAASGDQTLLRELRAEVAYRQKQYDIKAKGEENTHLETVMGMRNSGTPLARIKASDAWRKLSNVSQHNLAKTFQSEDQHAADRARIAADRVAMLETQKQIRDLQQLQRDETILRYRGADTYNTLRMNPEVLAAMDPAEVNHLRFFMSQDMVDNLVTLRGRVNTAQGKIDAKATESDLQNAYKEVYGKDLAKINRKGSEDDKAEAHAEVANLRLLIDTALAQEETTLKRNLTPEERQKTMRKLLAAKALEPGRWIGTNEVPLARVLTRGTVDERKAAVGKYLPGRADAPYANRYLNNLEAVTPETPR